MSTQTQEIQTPNNLGLTSEEIKTLVSLLQHPKIKDMAKEVEDKKKN
jgi:hypothetical protein